MNDFIKGEPSSVSARAGEGPSTHFLQLRDRPVLVKLQRTHADTLLLIAVPCDLPGHKSEGIHSSSPGQQGMCNLSGNEYTNSDFNICMQMPLSRTIPKFTV